jgi:urea transport system permease protein
VAVGGRGTLFGPILGAVVVNALKSWATRAIPDLWLILLGTLFLVVVLFLPQGLVSIPARLREMLRRTTPSPTPAPIAQTPNLPVP